ncbi:MAG: glycosyltransferase family 4 protein [Saprospiraceae bacterium]|nr:glycosyltransferase family 4 protein [Saprospiraceae bacterium]
MKILFVLESYYPNIGGVETLFKSLADALSARDHQVMVITTHPGGKVKRREVLGNVSIRRYNFINRYFFTLFAFIPVLLNAGKYDLIQTTSYNAGVPAFLGGLMNRKKTIITFHEYWNRLWFELPYFSRFSLWLHYLFEKMLAIIPFYKFIAVSESTRNNLIKGGVAAEKVEMIYNGIRYEEWQPVKKIEKASIFQFVYFGRLGISKGINLLLDAVRILKEQGTDFELVLIIPPNPSDLYSLILQFIEEQELSNHVKIMGHLLKSELIAVVGAADAVVIPSYSEGFCYSAVESVALKKPIVSSGRGALPEVVSGKYIVLEKLDAVELSKAMQEAMRGNWKEKETRYFHLDDTVANYLDLYEKILNP